MQQNLNDIDIAVIGSKDQVDQFVSGYANHENAGICYTKNNLLLYPIVTTDKTKLLEHYNQMSLFKNAILLIDNTDTNFQRQDFLMQSEDKVSNLWNVETCWRLHYSHLMIVNIDIQINGYDSYISDQLTQLFNSQHNLFNLKPLDYKMLKLDNVHESILSYFTVDKPEQKVNKSKKQQQVSSESIPIPDTSILLIHLFPESVLVKVLDGYLTQHQIIYIGDTVLQVFDIKRGNEIIEFGQANQLLFVKFLKVSGADLKAITVGRSHIATVKQYKKIYLDVQIVDLNHVITSRRFRKAKQVVIAFGFLKIEVGQLEIQGEVFEGKVVGTSDKQDHKLYRISFDIDQPYIPFTGLIPFTTNKSFSDIQFYGQLVDAEYKVTSYPLIPERVLLLEKYQTKNLNMEVNNVDMRYKCRICKEMPIQSVLVECGDLRYCMECVQLCIENKLCYYCEKPVTRCKRIDFVYVDKLESLSYDLKAYFQGQNKVPIPNGLKQLYQLQKENKNYLSSACQVCNKEYYTHYQFCEHADQHMMKTCRDCTLVKTCLEKDCGKAIVSAQRINYRFPNE